MVILRFFQLVCGYIYIGSLTPGSPAFIALIITLSVLVIGLIIVIVIIVVRKSRHTKAAAAAPWIPGSRSNLVETRT